MDCGSRMRVFGASLTSDARAGLFFWVWFARAKGAAVSDLFWAGWTHVSALCLDDGVHGRWIGIISGPGPAHAKRIGAIYPVIGQCVMANTLMQEGLRNRMKFTLDG